MKQAFCPILLLIAVHATSQRVQVFAPSMSIGQANISSQNLPVNTNKTFSISGGEFKFKNKDIISFHAVSVRTLDADLNKIQKSSMAVAGFGITFFEKSGISAKAYLSQGFNLRQGIIYYPRKENVTFEGLVPIFSIGVGAEYKIAKHVQLFSRLRWIGGDVTNRGDEGFSYGQFVFHTGICCKITAPKKIRNA